MSVPNNLEFTFRNLVIKKTGSEIKAIITSPIYHDARVADNDPPTQQIIEVSEEQFKPIWEILSQIDFEKLKNPGPENFIPPPSDVSISERLSFYIEGEIIINQAYQNLLFGEIVKPLEQIRSIINSKIN